MNREQRTITLSGIAAVVASLLFLYFYTGEPPVTPVGEQVGNQTEGSTDEVNLSDELLRTQDLKTGNSDPLNFTESVKVILAPGHGGSSSGGGHHGGGGGGGSRDRTPPTVNGTFSREPDTINDEYTHPVTVTWTGVDEKGGSGIDHCDAPTTYSGPDGVAIVLEGHCFDKAGNKGTGNVTLNFNSAETGNLAHSYDLTLDKIEISVGSDITASATTNNTSIKNVKFIWKDPAKDASATNTVKTVNGIAINSFTAPSHTGLWSVEAHFLDTANNDVIFLTEHFAVVQAGGGGGGGSPFTYSLIVNPETVEKNNAVMATATTNNTGIQNVTFVWTDNTGSVRETQVQPMSLAAVDSFTPDTVGEWRVDAHFNNATHLDVAIRIQTFDVTQGGSTGGDTTAPLVNGIFSRDPDTIDNWYTHPVTITWVGVDEEGGSGIASCEDPVTYSGPDDANIVLEGHCTDNAGNIGTGSVTFNYDETATGDLAHFYALSLSSNSINIGSSISASATTNNTSIHDVRFVWRNPSNAVAADKTIPTVNSADINTAVDIFAELDQTGIWSVNAHFLDTKGNEVFEIPKIFAVVQVGGDIFAYDLTVNPETVEKNHPVIANASTDNAVITNVLFVWTNPDNIVKASHLQPMPLSDQISRAVLDSFSPDSKGSWRVDAHFNNATHSDVAIRSEAFTVVKEGGGAGNHAPVAINDGSTTPEDTPVVINVLDNDIDSDGDTLSILSFTHAGHGSVTENDNGTLTYVPDDNFNGQDAFTYVISDGALQSANSATVTILVTPVNDSPVANAGLDQIVDEKSSVDLSGLESSDADGDVLAYSWNQTKGPSVELNDADSATPSFSAPEVDEDTVLTFELTVSDGSGDNSTDSVKITVLDNDDGGDGTEGTIKTTGGGAQIGKDVNFGFVAQSADGEAKGNLEYQDKTADINVHSISITSLELLDDNRATFEGIATINGNGEFAFIVIVEDNGEPGDNDWFSIEIPELGYAKDGTLTKGNIQIHE